MYVDDSIRSRVHEKCNFQLLNRQLRSLRVVLRGVTAVKAGCVDSDDTVGWEKRDREIEKTRQTAMSRRLNALHNVEGDGSSSRLMALRMRGISMSSSRSVRYVVFFRTLRQSRTMCWGSV